MQGDFLVYPNVDLGEGATIGPYVVIGVPPRGKQPGDLATVIGRNAVIRAHTVIYAGNRIGDGLQTGHHVAIREENEIGHEVSIGTGSIVEHHVKIGNGVRFHSNVFVPEFSVLEDECWLGPNVVLTNAKHPFSARTKEFLMGPTIERGAKIGANATLMPAVRIGRYSLVGAGAVVTKDVPPGVVVAGNPARVVKRVGELRHPDGEIVYPNVE